MNATDILIYGQRTLLGSIDGFPVEHWDTSGVCGVWSAKDVIAHLTSYERVLLDVFSEVQGPGHTPTLDTFRDAGSNFNDAQVAARKATSIADVLADLQSVHAQVMDAVAHIPADTLRQAGTLPWYGAPYALDDFIVYTSYGHKREHSAQIAVFRDTLAR